MNVESLIRMANQIATFYASQPEPDNAGAVANHLRRFWTPAMRAALLEHVRDSGTGQLHALAAEAASRMTKVEAA